MPASEARFPQTVTLLGPVLVCWGQGAESAQWAMLGPAAGEGKAVALADPT